MRRRVHPVQLLQVLHLHLELHHVRLPLLPRQPLAGGERRLVDDAARVERHLDALARGGRNRLVERQVDKRARALANVAHRRERREGVAHHLELADVEAVEVRQDDRGDHLDERGERGASRLLRLRAAARQPRANHARHLEGGLYPPRVDHGLQVVRRLLRAGGVDGQGRLRLGLRVEHRVEAHGALDGCHLRRRLEPGQQLLDQRRGHGLRLAKGEGTQRVGRERLAKLPRALRAR
mmetsp:Transcript_27175/g.46554  ORF Transcript_27175/g.46554 Transcript_27175/m.46554 type:complete len:237 (+) Transcript_27175:380-1090(+)